VLGVREARPVRSSMRSFARSPRTRASTAVGVLLWRRPEARRSAGHEGARWTHFWRQPPETPRTTVCPPSASGRVGRFSVVPVAQMPAIIAEHAEQPPEPNSTLRKTLGEQLAAHLGKIFALHSSAHRTRFSRYKEGTLLRRIRRGRLQVHRLTSIGAYLPSSWRRKRCGADGLVKIY